MLNTIKGRAPVLADWEFALGKIGLWRVQLLNCMIAMKSVVAGDFVC